MQYVSSDSRPEITPDAAPPIGQFYDIEGRRLLLDRSGTGNPPVVFAPGAGAISLDYLNIHDQVSRLTTSVLYDRAGTGWSDAIALPRTAAEVTDELRDLLHAAGLPAPYVLVGHSLGGLYMRHYAQRFPNEVAGLLLLDPAHEDYTAYMPQQLADMMNNWDPDQAFPEPDENVFQFYESLFTQMFAQWPDTTRETLIAYHRRAWRTGIQEGKNVNLLYDELRHGGDLPDVPLIVLTSMGVGPFETIFTPEPLLREANAGKARLYTAFAQTVPRGENRLLEGAGHVTIHTDRPDAVLHAIRDLLDRTRE